ncbi:peroxidase-related enzyme [Actinophytocola sp. S1-96]|uniref:Peroxidase-related enzyme n=1 Tax=Actinophytocola gossypii TaxID=2812003 RepID=A0ABT2JEZ8_9PSEU|nr:peroxidase-related enzyme [Actinophytocola gossypii]
MTLVINGSRGTNVVGVADEVSRFPVVELDELPDDLRERVAAVADKSGFVPNVFLALGHRPAELRAFMDYHDAVMERDSGLSKAERELVVVATSGANSCTYCVVAHGAILRIRAKDPRIADDVATNPWTVELDDRRRAIVDLALALAVDPSTFSSDELDAARDAGLTDDEIWDVGAITALFALSNRIAHLTALRPNDEFYLMGRLPRA